MQKSLLVLMSLVCVSSAQAYTLKLESNAVFANKNCTLQLGKKVYEESIHAGRPDLMVQDAVITTKQGTYTFELQDARQYKDQEKFGQLDKQIFPTFVYISKVGKDAISLKAIAEDVHGRTDLRFDCGIMVAK